MAMFSMGEHEPDLDLSRPSVWLVLWGSAGNPLSQVAGVYDDQSDALGRAKELMDSGAAKVTLGELVRLGDGLSGSNFKIWNLVQLNDD